MKNRGKSQLFIVALMIIFLSLVCFGVMNTPRLSAKAVDAPTTQKGGLIYIESGAVYTLQDGEISNGTKYYGGAIFVANGGTLIMEGGTIKDCSATYGGGIYVEAGATCTITGGAITNCTADYGPAIYVEKGATFSCTSPDISESQIEDKNKGFTLGTIPSQVTVMKDGTKLSSGATLYPDDILTITFTVKNDYCINLEVTGATRQGSTDNYVVNNNVTIKYTEKSASTSLLKFTLKKTYYEVSIADTSTSGSIIVPAYYNGKPVTTIAEKGFYNAEKITSVTLPDTITTIGYMGFYHCTRLKTINIPFGVTSIENRAFWYCSALTTLTLPDTVNNIGSFAFGTCINLISINIPEGVETIGLQTFTTCGSLRTIVIPDSVTSIGEEAFSSCMMLNNITIGSGVKSIEASAFSSCNALKNVTYHGTKEEWEALKENIASGNSYLLNATITFSQSTFIPDFSSDQESDSLKIQKTAQKNENQEDKQEKYVYHKRKKVVIVQSKKK